ncbi:MAG: hydro-lyase [Rhodospirillaceae bacterium]|nr:hydro-lyase [Rhodospirillaceae bacterium]|tara:strand:+ start:333 stop:1541 length:1209 start_codon:yes stop_codon:yes gene_type:complete
MSTIAVESHSANRVTDLSHTSFQGYLRSDGRAGVRNYLLVLSTVALTNRWADLISSKHKDALAITGDFLRGLRGNDQLLQDDVLAKLAAHPNVGAVLILCFDRFSADQWRKRIKSAGQSATVLSLMDQKGMTGALEEAQKELSNLDKIRRKLKRTSIPLSKLTIALECGGSDATSAICANPSIGCFVTSLVESGGSSIISETAEFIGAEDVVRERAVSSEVAEQILTCILAADERTDEEGERYRGVNPTHENIEAGLTTLVEKSMGAVCKIGDLSIDGCLEFAQEPPGSGLYFMDTPFFSPVSLSGMAASGAQLVLFALGVFNPSGNPLVPTIKVCGNVNTLAAWNDSIDVSVSGLVDRSISLEEAAQKIATMVMKTASGQESRAEHWGEGQVIVPKTRALI